MHDSGLKMEKAAGSGTGQSTLPTNSSTVQTEQPVLLEAASVSVLSVPQEAAHESTQPVAQPIATRSITPSQAAASLKPDSLRQTSQVSIWLDRNLPLIYQKAEALKQQTEHFYAQAGLTSNRPDHIREAKELYKEHFELLDEYFNHLDKHPDEQAFLVQYAQGKPCHSRSELAYEQIHSAILLQLENLYSLPQNFSFNFDIANAFETQFKATMQGAAIQLYSMLAGAVQPLALVPAIAPPILLSNDPVMEVISTRAPDRMIYQMLRLTECLFQCSGFNRTDTSLEKKLPDLSRYLINIGLTLSTLKQAGIPIERQLESAIRQCTRMSDLLDKVDDYMLNVVFKDNPRAQFWCITGSLRFSYFLRPPTSTCRLLYHLDSYTTPSEEELTTLLRTLMDLIEKSRSEWTPFQAAVFCLQDQGWINDKPDIPAIQAFKELLEAVRSSPEITYPPELCVLQTPAPIPAEKWMSAPCPSQFQGSCQATKTLRYYSLPAIKHLWSDILALPCMSASLPAIDQNISHYLCTGPNTKLKEISDKAHKLWETVANIDGAKKEHQNSQQTKRPTAWIKSAKAVTYEYKKYLDTHLQERLLVHGAASFNKKHNSRVQRLLEAHYHLQHLSFLYHRGLFGTQAVRSEITQLCQKALEEKKPTAQAEKISHAVSAFSKFQQDYAEIIAGRFLLAHCFLAQQWQTKEVAVFVEETSQDMLDCIADCYQIILEIEQSATHEQ